MNSSLLSALAEQFRRESLPWVRDLVEPLLQGPPPPLTDTVDPEALADRDSKWVSVAGLRIHYKQRLPGEREGRLGPSADGLAAAPADPDAAPPLLLLHGLNGSTFNWRLLLDDLAAYVSPATGGCRVIAYDRPPYGLSQRPTAWASEHDNPYTVEGGARLAAGLLDALGCGGRPAVLVGHSAGAAVAVEAALRFPDRVCGLVLISPAISTNERGYLSRADLGQLLRLLWLRALLSTDGPGLNYIRRQLTRRKAQVEAGELGLFTDEAEVPQEVIDGLLRPLRAHDWDKGSLLAYRAFPLGGGAPALGALRVPVLVVQGREDTTTPLEGAERVVAALRKRGAGAVTEFAVLDRCGHLPMDERPLEVLEAVVAFLNRHCYGRA